MRAVVEMECSPGTKEIYRILEIGSWAGGSAVTWADAIKRFNGGRGLILCVDPWVPFTGGNRERGEIYGIMDQALRTGRILDLFIHNIRTSSHEDVVRVIRARSDEILPLFGPEQLDLVFVDGQHTYAQVLQDLRNGSRIVREGGILCGDDLELQLPAVDFDHAKGNADVDYMRDPRTGDWFHPGVTLAVAEWFGSVSAWDGFWAMRKRKGGWEKIVSERFESGEVQVPEHLI